MRTKSWGEIRVNFQREERKFAGLATALICKGLAGFGGRCGSIGLRTGDGAIDRSVNLTRCVLGVGSGRVSVIRFARLAGSVHTVMGRLTLMGRRSILEKSKQHEICTCCFVVCIPSKKEKARLAPT